MLEEEVLDTHKMVMDHTNRFVDDARNVFSMTHEVDYDQEGKTMVHCLSADSGIFERTFALLHARAHAHTDTTLANARTHACTYACTHASTHV